MLDLGIALQALLQKRDMTDKTSKTNRPSPEANTFPSHRHVFSILFVCVIAMPAVLGLMHVNGSAHPGKRRSPSAGMQWRLLLAPDYYDGWGRYLSNRVKNAYLTHAKNWLDYRLFNMSDARAIYVGRNGWLFERRSIDALGRADCGRGSHILALVHQLETIAHLMKAGGRDFIFSVVPDKSTVYREKVGVLPGASGCSNTPYDLLLAEHERRPIKCFVRLDDILGRAKFPGTLLYDKTGATWNARGASVAANALLGALYKIDGPDGDRRNDLYAAMMGKAKQHDGPPSGGAGYGLSSAVVYGGRGLAGLAAGLSRPFNRIDIIGTDTIPSRNHDENLANYDTIIVAPDESRLASLVFDFDGLCRMLQAESLADAVLNVPLKTVSAETRLSLRLQGEGLAVKSLGADAYLAFPSLPGSDARTLRLLAVDISSARPERLTWAIAGSPDCQGGKRLRPGSIRFYWPLPAEKAVRMRINPGRAPGLFTFHRALVLEFARARPGSPLGGKDTSGPGVLAPAGAHRPTGPVPPSMAGDTFSEDADARVPQIQLHDCEDLRVFQRSGNAADIMVSGTYTGRPSAVEARILRHDSGAPVTPWRMIDGSPGGGVFMGVLAGVPQGGWYRLAVRFTDRPGISALGTSRWGIGMLVGCIGQSNMKEWFFSGRAETANPLLVFHREGQWTAPAQNGNGAIAFGNRLISKLAIPVALLDGAVNGSGLRKEADWGEGYWTDRSDGSIYRRFVQEVATTGGILEYVVWMQGEADAARGTITENEYRSSLAAFIEKQVRRDIGNGSRLPRLPFLIVGMVKRPIGSDAPHQAVRNAQNRVAEEMPSVYLAATSLDLKNLGRQHLAPESYSILGLRVAQTILYLLDVETYYRGPSIIMAERVDASTIDVHLAHRGGNDFTPPSRISGWQASMRETPVPVDGVWRTDGRTVRIRLGKEVQGPVTLRYLYGAMPEADHAVHDNSELRLPLEPLPFLEVE